MSEKALVPLAEKQVEFYGDELTAVLVNIHNRSEIYVPVKPIADALGLDWSAPVSYTHLMSTYEP